MKITTFDSASYCGYTQKTTFFTDFSIADLFGAEMIKDTYRRAFSEWKHNTECLTELVLVLNWKCWEHQDREDYCTLYCDLFYKCRDWALDHLKGEDLEYFWRTTD